MGLLGDWTKRRTADTRADASLEQGLLVGISVFRWLAWAWMAAVVVVARDKLSNPLWAVLPIVAAFVYTAYASVTARQPFSLNARRIRLGVELTIGSVLLVADHFVWTEDPGQSLEFVWPLAGVIEAGVVFGSRWGLAMGGLLGLVNGIGIAVASEPRLFEKIRALPTDPSSRALSVVSTAFMYALAGLVVGLITERLRQAERDIAAAEAREDVARTLHDGVLQTLAVVQRRTDDPELGRLARDTENDLREYLFGVAPVGGTLGPALREAAARYERMHGGRVQVVMLEEGLPTLGDRTVEALAGAVGEALTNAGKHGSADRVTIYVEQSDRNELFCSVKDDGVGFDRSTNNEGVGISRSIRGRIERVGGRVEIDTAPTRGTEVRLWVPC